MESEFVTAVADWRDFFDQVAAAAATLIGLLFVGVALNPSIMADDGPIGLRAWMGQTFHSFLTLLILALIVLIPEPSPTTLGISLLITGGQGLYQITQNIRRARTDPSPEWRGRSGILRFGSPLIAYVLCVISAIGIWRGNADMLGWLVGVVFFLVIGSSINCWELLKTIGDRHKLEQAGLPPTVVPDVEPSPSQPSPTGEGRS